jgi:hypothetical protein
VHQNTAHIPKIFRNNHAATRFYNTKTVVHLSTSIYKRPYVTSTATTSSCWRLALATSATSSKIEDRLRLYEELAGSLIVSQQGQFSHPPHQICHRSPQGPPRAPNGSTPAGAPPRATSLWPEPDSPPTARLSCAARSRCGGHSFGWWSAHPEHAAVGCGCCRGCRP